MCACVCERECGVRECVRDWTAYKKNTACGQFVSVTGTYGPSDAKKTPTPQHVDSLSVTGTHVPSDVKNP